MKSRKGVLVLHLILLVYNITETDCLAQNGSILRSVSLTSNSFKQTECQNELQKCCVTFFIYSIAISWVHDASSVQFPLERTSLFHMFGEEKTTIFEQIFVILVMVCLLHYYLYLLANFTKKLTIIMN